LICAAALECLQIIEDEKLLENVRSRGEELKAGLQALAAKFDFIREVRAEGLMLGVQLSVEGAPFVAEAAKRGLLINCTHDRILRLLPPFIVTRAQVCEFFKLFSAVLAGVSEKSAVAETSTSVTKPSKKYATAR
jgi:acetylornithine/N-succinyldiaminopimelate aminotransferase